MHFINNILATIDIAVVRRSDISKLKKSRARLKDKNAKLKEKNAQLADANTRLTANNTQLEDKNAQLRKESDWRRQYKGLFPLMNSLSNAYLCGPLPPYSRVALVMAERHLGLVPDFLADRPDCRLEFVALYDFSENSPTVAHVACPINGTRAVTVGKIAALRDLPHLERMLCADGLSEAETDRAACALAEAVSGQFYLTRQLETDPDCRRNTLFIETWSAQLENLAKSFNDLQSIHVFAGKARALATGNPAYNVISGYPAGLHPAVLARSGDILLIARAAVDEPVTLGEKGVQPEHIYVCAPENAPGSGCENGTDRVPVTRLTACLTPYNDAGINRLLRGDAAEDTDCANPTATTLDAVVAENAIRRLDYISLDLGGGELSALHGAAVILEKYKPNLAVALHNDPLDLLNIPEYLLSLNLGYCLYLGHHGITQRGTFLYATVRPKG